MTERKNKNQLLEKAILYLESHNLLTMATASKSGIPNAACLEYANKEMDIYVHTMKGSWKAKNIQENPQVFYEIHDQVDINRDNIKNIKGLQVLAAAEIFQNPTAEFNEAWNIMIKKYKVFNLIPLNEKHVILHFMPKKLWLLDYGVKFGHRDEYEF